VTTTLVTHGNATIGVTTTILALLFDQRLMGVTLVQLRGYNPDDKTPAGRSGF
jgi:hypothetical protein